MPVASLLRPEHSRGQRASQDQLAGPGDKGPALRPCPASPRPVPRRSPGGPLLSGSRLPALSPLTCRLVASRSPGRRRERLPAGTVTIACLRPPGDTSAGDPGALRHKESACLSGRHAQLCGYANSVAACSNVVPSNMPIFTNGICTEGPHWRQRTAWTKGPSRSPRQRWC